jgi:hypothetical protein
MRRFLLLGLLLPWIILFMLRFFSILNELLFEQILISGIVSGALAYYFLNKNQLSKLLKRIVAITFILIFILTAQNLLLNIDRSRSFYVLSWVELGKVSSTTGGLSLNGVYSEEKLAVSGIKLRIFEQEKRGLISKTNGIYRLTFAGNIVLSVAERLAFVYKLENWKANKY